jgi:hypothetical protein
MTVYNLRGSLKKRNHDIIEYDKNPDGLCINNHYGVGLK